LVLSKTGSPNKDKFYNPLKGKFLFIYYQVVYLMFKSEGIMETDRRIRMFLIREEKELSDGI